jgi:hypothetical protein
VLGAQALAAAGVSASNSRSPGLPAATESAAVGEKNVRKLVKTSQYRGVRFCKKSLKWIASISHKGKVRRLGVFTEEEAAAKAYDAAAYDVIASQPEVPTRHQPKPNFTKAGKRIPYSRRTRRHDKVKVEDLGEVIHQRRTGKHAV